MEQAGIEKAWSLMGELETGLDELGELFHSTYEPDSDGRFPYHKEFSRKFRPLARKQNRLALSLMREILRREFGETYRGVYPAAGSDAAFCHGLGGQWHFIDRAYNNRIELVGDDGTWATVLKSVFGIEMFEAKAVTHDFLSGELPEGVSPGSFDVGLIRHPYGVLKSMTEYTGYEPPEGGPVAKGPEWWDGLLMHSIVPLREGGILVSGMDLESNRENSSDPGAREAIGRYAGQLERMGNLLGAGTGDIPFAEYKQRAGNAEPQCLGYSFYMKRGSVT